MRVPSLPFLLLTAVLVPRLAIPEALPLSNEEINAQLNCQGACDQSAYVAIGAAPPMGMEQCLSLCYRTHYSHLTNLQSYGGGIHPLDAYAIAARNRELPPPNFYDGLPPPLNTAPPPTPVPIPEEDPPGPFESLLGAVGSLVDSKVGAALGAAEAQIDAATAKVNSLNPSP